MDWLHSWLRDEINAGRVRSIRVNRERDDATIIRRARDDVIARRSGYYFSLLKEKARGRLWNVIFLVTRIKLITTIITRKNILFLEILSLLSQNLKF